MLSQLFVLSTRGDTILTRNFRGDLIKGTNEIFFRKVKLGDPWPVFNVEGINFLHIKRGGLYIVVTSRQNVSPAFVFDLLELVVKVIKDYLGVLNEEALRKNFVLAYEIIDEIIDYGNAQSTSTEQIKPYIVNEAAAEEKKFEIKKPKFLNPNKVSYTAANKPITKTKKNTNEIFVDVVERVNALFNSSGYILNSGIQGCIKMKSYLQGNPQLRLGFNPDLAFGSSPYGRPLIEDCNFHECVNHNEFEDHKVLTISPPAGEFVVMNYRIMGDYQTLFRLLPVVDHISPYKVELNLRVQSCFSADLTATKVALKIQLPKVTNSVNFGAPKGHTTEYQEPKKRAEWVIPKFKGGEQHSLNLSLSVSRKCSQKEIGPVAMVFEIANHGVSNMQIKYLKVSELSHTKNPTRWIRYITQSGSYVCRV